MYQRNLPVPKYHRMCAQETAGFPSSKIPSPPGLYAITAAVVYALAAVVVNAITAAEVYAIAVVVV